MTRFIIETPSGYDELEGDISPENLSLEVMACLLNDQEPWCRLWLDGNRGWTTEWSVMERNADLVPVKILSRDFDGETTIIDNVPKQEA